MNFFIREDNRGIYGHWTFKKFDIVEFITEPDQKILITTDGTTTTAKLFDGKKTVKTAEAHCCPADTFDFMTGAKLAFERLTEEKKEEPKPEPQEAIKLYCVKSNKGSIDFKKGGIYTQISNRVYDTDGEKLTIASKDWIKECFVPLVKRPAKAMEWVLVVESRGCGKYGYYEKGDVFKCVKDDYGAGNAIIVDCKRWMPAYRNTTTQLLDSRVPRPRRIQR